MAVEINIFNHQALADRVFIFDPLGRHMAVSDLTCCPSISSETRHILTVGQLWVLAKVIIHDSCLVYNVSVRPFKKRLPCSNASHRAWWVTMFARRVIFSHSFTFKILCRSISSKSQSIGRFHTLSSIIHL